MSHGRNCLKKDQRLSNKDSKQPPDDPVKGVLAMAHIYAVHTSPPSTCPRCASPGDLGVLAHSLVPCQEILHSDEDPLRVSLSFVVRADFVFLEVESRLPCLHTACGLLLFAVHMFFLFHHDSFEDQLERPP